MDKNPQRDEKGKGLRKEPWKTKLKIILKHLFPDNWISYPCNSFMVDGLYTHNLTLVWALWFAIANHNVSRHLNCAMQLCNCASLLMFWWYSVREICPQRLLSLQLVRRIKTGREDLNYTCKLESSPADTVWSWALFSLDRITVLWRLKSAKINAYNCESLSLGRDFLGSIIVAIADQYKENYKLRKKNLWKDLRRAK